jgi:GNAT superfamily N-acetyltransferase
VTGGAATGGEATGGEATGGEAGPRARAATPADVPALADLRWRWRVAERDEPGGDEAAFRAYFADWVTGHWTTHLPFVVEVDGAVCGMAWLMLADRVPAPGVTGRRTGDIQAVYVAPEHRDAGVGGVLLDAVLAEAGRRGLEHVTVHSSGRAVPFYRRAGFVEGDNWLSWRP